MNCKQVQDLLPEYVDRQVRQVFLRDIEAHLRGCDECSKLLAVYRDNIRILGAFPEIEPPPDLAAKIFERTARRGLIRAWIERYLSLPRYILLPVAAGLLVAVLAPVLLSNDAASRSATKYAHRAWSFTLKLYGRAEGVGQEMASLKNLVFLILDERVEELQEQVQSYKARKQTNEQRRSQSSYLMCGLDSAGSDTQGADSNVLRQS
ncbi:MAG: zf-HC2 domain-containing protein [Acidobacteriota bacterium]